MSADSAQLKHCEQLVGKRISGERKGGFWHVKQLVEKRIDGSGGQFSIGYIAVHEDGSEAFLKATDIGLLTRAGSATDALTRMQRAISEQAFERKILEICRGNNMDRIVHAIDYGQIEVMDGGIRDIVFCIMFERAVGDVRIQISRAKKAGLSWALHALHNLAVAIQQLHTQKIAHNDVKPSNFLVFDDYLQKLADLGRATSEHTYGPWDSVNYAGDFTYAAPEFWYPNVRFPRRGDRVEFTVRRASDLYHLGSMGFFLVTGQKITPALRAKLRIEHNPLNWRGNFYAVLPYLRDAMAECLDQLDEELPRNSDGSLYQEAVGLHSAIAQLCDPDPDQRGHPLNAGPNFDQYSLERYISFFSSASKTLRIRERS